MKQLFFSIFLCVGVLSSSGQIFSSQSWTGGYNAGSGYRQTLLASAPPFMSYNSGAGATGAVNNALAALFTTFPNSYIAGTNGLPLNANNTPYTNNILGFEQSLGASSGTFLNYQQNMFIEQQLANIYEAMMASMLEMEATITDFDPVAYTAGFQAGLYQ